MIEARYAVVFDSLDAAITAHVEGEGSEVLELQPVGTLRPICWDGERPEPPIPVTAPGGSVFSFLAKGLAANPLAFPPDWYPPSNLLMPDDKPGPADQAES